MFDTRKKIAAALTALALAATAGACSPQQSSDDNDGLAVLAAFYPLAFVAEQVGGDRVDVTTLTPQGAEPHDLELAPAQTRQIDQADLVLFQTRFQPAVDAAIADNPDVVERIKGGHMQAIGALMGPIMKATRGQADPKQARELIMKKIG